MPLAFFRSMCLTTIVIDNPLASGFDILLGIIEITVPSVAANSDYQIVCK